MNITDELREYTEKQIKWLDVSKVHYRKMFAIADRIDAEHERECKEQYACGAEHGIGASIDALVIQTHGFVELPKDADGEVIHIGDVMENIVCPSVHREVTGVGVECFYGWDEGNGRYSQFDANRYRYYHAPTVEDVLREFAEKITDSQIPDVHPTYEEAIAEYADKLQLREDA